MLGCCSAKTFLGDERLSILLDSFDQHVLIAVGEVILLLQKLVLIVSNIVWTEYVTHLLVISADTLQKLTHHLAFVFEAKSCEAIDDLFHTQLGLRTDLFDVRISCEIRQVFVVLGVREEVELNI